MRTTASLTTAAVQVTYLIFLMGRCSRIEPTKGK